MIPKTDGTHDPALRSWVESANDGATDFPIQNLPLGVFRRAGDGGASRIGVRDRRPGARPRAPAPSAACCAACRRRSRRPARGETLNALMALEPARARHAAASAVAPAACRGRLRRRRAPTRPRCCCPPATPRCCCRRRSATTPTSTPRSTTPPTSARMFRPDNPLLPNYKWVPIGYHGRASSLVVSGTPVARPSGQTAPGDAERAALRPHAARSTTSSRSAPSWAPATRSARRSRSPRPRSTSSGCACVNDWSARDVQKWEYQPLGPFLGQELRDDASRPWVVTLEALAPYRVPAFARADGRPAAAPLPAHAERPRAAAGSTCGSRCCSLTRAMRDEGARAVPAEPQQPARPLLDAGADGRPPRARTAATCGPAT